MGKSHRPQCDLANCPEQPGRTGMPGGDLFSQRADSAAEGALPQHPCWGWTDGLWPR